MVLVVNETFGPDSLEAHLAELLKTSAYSDIGLAYQGVTSSKDVELRAHRAVLSTLVPDTFLSRATRLRVPWVSERIARAMLELAYLGKCQLESTCEIRELKSLSVALKFGEKLRFGEDGLKLEDDATIAEEESEKKENRVDMTVIPEVEIKVEDEHDERVESLMKMDENDDDDDLIDEDDPFAKNSEGKIGRKRRKKLKGFSKLKGPRNPVWSSEHKCPICPAAVCNNSRLKEHIRTLHPEADYDALKEQIDPKPFMCKYCGQRFAKIQTHFDHEARHEITTNEIACEEPGCVKMFPTKLKMKSHYYQHHGTYARKRGKAKVFKSNEKRETKGPPRSQASIENYNEDGTCKHCGKFVTSNRRVKHWRMHTGDKPFQCQDCGQKFSTKSIMQTHQAYKHSDERHFTCEFCTKKMVVQADYRLHLKKAHGKNLLFQCSVCLALGRPNELRHHVKKCNSQLLKVLTDNESSDVKGQPIKPVQDMVVRVQS